MKLNYFIQRNTLCRCTFCYHLCYNKASLWKKFLYKLCVLTTEEILTEAYPERAEPKILTFAGQHVCSNALCSTHALVHCAAHVVATFIHKLGISNLKFGRYRKNTVAEPFSVSIN